MPLPNFLQMLTGASAPAADPSMPDAAPAPMAAAVNPNPLGESKPAGTPEELAARKAGWTQIFSNPNFKMALMMAGQSLAQPIPFGQSPIGHAANALGMGAAAYNAGEYSDWEKGLKDREADRRDELVGAQAENSRQEAANKGAARPGIEAKSDVEVATKDAQVEKYKVDLDRAKTARDVEAAEAGLKKRRAEIEASIPDEKVRAAALAEVDAAALKAQEARARLKTLEASGKKETAKAGQEEITTEVLQNMDPQERKEFLTKTGRYNQHISSASTTRDMYGSLYDALAKSAPDDPRIKGKTREQFMLDGMTSQKSLDATTALKNYMTAVGQANIDPDPDIVEALSSQIRSTAKAKAGGKGAAAAPAPGQPERWVRGPDGKLRREAQPTQ